MPATVGAAAISRRSMEMPRSRSSPQSSSIIWSESPPISRKLSSSENPTPGAARRKAARTTVRSSSSDASAEAAFGRCAGGSCSAPLRRVL